VCDDCTVAHRRTYETDAIRVDWDSARCIHPGICLRTLPSVFDLGRRPWVDLNAADADAVADAVERCPTGALRYERLDGADAEVPERPTIVIALDNGPLVMAGDLDVRQPDGEQITREARLTLCRCGLTHNQPLCDNSHRRRGWISGPSSEPASALPPPSEQSEAQPTTIVPGADASLELRGDVRVYDGRGQRLAETRHVFLCRCGRSANKPFCDGSHARAGFRSREPRPEPVRATAESPAAFEPNPGMPDRKAT
jgi:CDGSH-type Zn-finger protein/uncharacterized Fe-S cluster protein YjdI